MTKLEDYAARQALAKRRKRKPGSMRNKATEKRKGGCRGCGAWPIEMHHIVHRSKLPTLDKDRDCDDNLMPLCHDCHQGHHTRTQPVPRDWLSPAEWAFASSRVSEAWLDIWYPL